MSGDSLSIIGSLNYIKYVIYIHVIFISLKILYPEFMQDNAFL